MSTDTIIREAATGRFAEHDNTLNEVVLPGGLGDMHAMVAATSIHHEAPIGARTASLYVDAESGHITFDRYIDAAGKTVDTDGIADFNDTLRGATIDGFANQPGVLKQDQDGETWFIMDVEDI